MGKPKKYKAKDKNGVWWTGWYAELHIPKFDNHGGQIGERYGTMTALFNDEDGERSKGGYWHTIDPATLTEIADKPKQLSLFDNGNE